MNVTGTAFQATTIQGNDTDQAMRDWIARAQRGDQAAYGELVRRNWDRVVAVVYRMCGDPALSEEAAQEAFLRAWQHLSGYQPQHSFRAWVYRIAINAALDALRAQKPTVDVDGMEDKDLPAESLLQSSEDGNPEEALESRERAGRIRQAVMALSPASRAVLVLREYGGLSYAEIAGTLNIPLGTVMSLLNSARAQLRQSLAGLLEVL